VQKKKKIEKKQKLLKKIEFEKNQEKLLDKQRDIILVELTKNLTNMEQTKPIVSESVNNELKMITDNDKLYLNKNTNTTINTFLNSYITN